MEARYFYFTVHSANKLPYVRHICEMNVYAKVSMSGKTKYTEVDYENGTNPIWRTKLCFIVPEKDIIEGCISAEIELFAQRTFKNDKYVGELSLSLNPHYRGERISPVRSSDSSFGNLRFSHALGDKLIVDNIEDADTSSSSPPPINYKRLIDRIIFGVSLAKTIYAFVKALDSDDDE